jgi:hypothetical protein
MILETGFVMTVDLDPPPPSTPDLDIVGGTMNLLKLFDRHDLKATFFVTASVATEFPETVREVAKRGHEIGCHGLKHDANEATLSFEKENTLIETATEDIETVTGIRPVGFRAPLFRVKRDCWMALVRNGYVYDSSLVSSPLYRNFEISWLSKPFFLFPSPQRASNLIEIPVSVNPLLPVPVGGAFLRIFGQRWAVLAFRTYRILKIPFVFHIHPKDVIPRNRGAHWHSYRNTDKCERMLDLIIGYAKDTDVRFRTAREVAETYFGETDSSRNIQVSSSSSC